MPLLVVLVEILGALGGALIYLVRSALTLAMRARGTEEEFPRLWPLREGGWLVASILLMALPLSVASRMASA